MPLSKIDSDSLNSGAVTSAALGSTLTFTGQQTIPTINLTGGQITFPATQVPSANANTLDDYEEGTWTPTIKSEAGTITSVSYIAQSGRYTKIGNTVYIACLVGWNGSNWGTGTGDIQVSGLPFAAIDANFIFATESLNVNWPNTGTIVGQTNGATAVFFRVSQNNGDWASILITSQSTSGEDNYFRFSGFYMVS